MDVCCPHAYLPTRSHKNIQKRMLRTFITRNKCQFFNFMFHPLFLVHFKLWEGMCRAIKENSVFAFSMEDVFFQKGFRVQVDLVVYWLIVQLALKEYGAIIMRPVDGLHLGWVCSYDLDSNWPHSILTSVI